MTYYKRRWKVGKQCIHQFGECVRVWMIFKDLAKKLHACIIRGFSKNVYGYLNYLNGFIVAIEVVLCYPQRPQV